MRRLAVIVLLLVFALTPFAQGQGGSEVDALLDAFFAKDLKALMPHLPPELNKALVGTSVQTQASFLNIFLIRQEAEKRGAKFTRPTSGPVLIGESTRQSPEGEDAPLRVEIFLDKRMMDGNETMLRFHAKSSQEYDGLSGKTLSAWMRFVDGEWRLYEIESEGKSIKLDDPKFLEGLAHAQMNSGEVSAVGSMRVFNTAEVTYAATYPEIGFSISIAALAGDGEPTVDRAGLIDPTLGTPPHVKGGYRFSYTPHAGSPNETYEFRGRPVEYGVNGTRSFFTDQSGVIRFTTEDREPTVEDPPLK